MSIELPDIFKLRNLLALLAALATEWFWSDAFKVDFSAASFAVFLVVYVVVAWVLEKIARRLLSRRRDRAD